MVISIFHASFSVILLFFTDCYESVIFLCGLYVDRALVDNLESSVVCFRYPIGQDGRILQFHSGASA